MSESLVAGTDPAGKRAMTAALMPRNKRQLTDLQKQVAQAYGQGFNRRQIATAVLEHLTPDTVGKPMAFRRSRALRRLRMWEKQQAFRDHVYQTAVTEVDMATPLILNGVVQKAIRGRVDAARLALELTGRHNPKGEQSAPTVSVHIDGIPRPRRIADAEVVDADAVER